MWKLRRSGKWREGTYASSLSVRDASSSPQTFGQWVGVVLVLAMFAIAGLVGLLTLWAGLSQYLVGALPLGNAIVAVLLGVAFATLGLGFFYVRYFKQPLWDSEKARLAARYPGQPWMLRKDWASRRIVYSNAGVAALLWLWNVGWWGGLALIGMVNREKILAALESSWWSYALLAFLLLCGIVVLCLAIAATRSHWRFGRSVLRLDTLPAYVGEPLRGTVEARLSARSTAPLKAALICERLDWITSRRGRNTTTRLDVKELARIEREIPPSRVLVSRAGSRIPVEIDVPPQSAEYSIDSKGNGVRWTLHVEATAQDALPFAATFEVPVYRRRR